MIGKVVFKVWSIFPIQNLWYSFTRGNSFLQTPSQSLLGKQKNPFFSIIYGTFNFNVSIPPPCKHANTKSIQKVNSTFDWSKVFLCRNANEKCKILIDILLDVFKSFILHKTQKCDYKNPAWMNRMITLSIKKIKTYQEIIC